MLNHEAAIRFGAFATILTFMALWECVSPKRQRSFTRLRRWPNNFGVSVVDSIVTRILAPAGAVGFAVLAEAQSWGLFHIMHLPAWIENIASFVLLDLAIYLQHRIFHYVPLLWRLHRMHHADLDVDVTTGARFHPVEILLSLGIKFVVVVMLGAPALAVLIFEVVLNATSMFNHSNVRVPPGIERVLRWLVVTPDMHCVHHSIVRSETDSNFGFNFPWWDRLFRTYKGRPEAGQEGIMFGIEQFRQPEELRLDRLLTQPFRTDRDSQR